jgi:hypothetical protein
MAMVKTEKHRQSEKLDLQEVKDYFTEKGYEAINVEQVWRHVTGVLKKENNNYFLKLSSTLGVAERTRNEFEWNNLVNSLSDDQRLPVSIPQNHDSGEFKGLFWYLGEYAGNKVLTRPAEKNETDDLERELSVITETAYKIIGIETDLTLPLDKKISEEERKEKFFKKLEHWAEQTPEDVSGLISFIRERYDYLDTASSHGDFVPWHFIRSEEGKLFLVDGEHAHIVGLKFYDVAYFYHRVFTKLKRSDIADRFLRDFSDLYKFSEGEKELFRLVLAQRLVGGYFDAEKDGITSVNLQNKLKTRLLQGRLFIPGN